MAAHLDQIALSASQGMAARGWGQRDTTIHPALVSSSSAHFAAPLLLCTTSMASGGWLDASPAGIEQETVYGSSSRMSQESLYVPERPVAQPAPWRQAAWEEQPQQHRQQLAQPQPQPRLSQQQYQHNYQHCQSHDQCQQQQKLLLLPQQPRCVPRPTTPEGSILASNSLNLHHALKRLSSQRSPDPCAPSARRRVCSFHTSDPPPPTYVSSFSSGDGGCSYSNSRESSSSSLPYLQVSRAAAAATNTTSHLAFIVTERRHHDSAGPVPAATPPAVLLRPSADLRLSPLELGADDYIMCAARVMQLNFDTTARLALHIWRRVSGMVQVLRSIRASPSLSLRGGSDSGNDAGGEACSVTPRVYAAACLWLAAKLEEERREAPTAGVVAAVCQTGPGILCAVELRILEWVHWSPCQGYLS